MVVHMSCTLNGKLILIRSCVVVIEVGATTSIRSTGYDCTTVPRCPGGSAGRGPSVVIHGLYHARVKTCVCYIHIPALCTTKYRLVCVVQRFLVVKIAVETDLPVTYLINMFQSVTEIGVVKSSAG